VTDGPAGQVAAGQVAAGQGSAGKDSAGQVSVGRVTVDRDLCVSSGMCESVAPALFEIDDDGELVVLQDVVPDALLADAQAAARACPTRALTVA